MLLEFRSYTVQHSHIQHLDFREIGDLAFFNSEKCLRLKSQESLSQNVAKKLMIFFCWNSASLNLEAHARSKIV